MNHVTSQVCGLFSMMLITNKLERSPTGGREMLCKLNHDVLLDIYGKQLVVLELTKSPISGLKSIVNAFRGHIDGITTSTIDRAFQLIIANNVRNIFVDGSNFGGIVKSIKNHFPDVQVYTFFHNVEVRFFWGFLKQNKTIHALAVTIANYLAENKSVKFSDKIICLSARDSQLLNKLYGRAATHVSPMVLQDKLPVELSSSTGFTHEKFALFVGGVFYANLVGITWFVKNVAPRIGIKVCIVGKGFEKFRDQLEQKGIRLYSSRSAAIRLPRLQSQQRAALSTGVIL